MIALRKSLPATPSRRIPRDDDALLAQCEQTHLRGYEMGTVHRTSRFTGVRLRHLPSGITVLVRRHPSQKQNLEEALTRLRHRLEAKLAKPVQRLPLSPNLGEQGSRLQEKHRRSRKKALRRPPEEPEGI